MATRQHLRRYDKSAPPFADVRRAVPGSSAHKFSTISGFSTIVPTKVIFAVASLYLLILLFCKIINTTLLKHECIHYHIYWISEDPPIKTFQRKRKANIGTDMTKRIIQHKEPAKRLAAHWSISGHSPACATGDPLIIITDRYGMP